MGEETVHDQLMVNQNWLKLFRPELYAKKLAEATKRSEKRKAECTAQIDSLG